MLFDDELRATLYPDMAIVDLAAPTESTIGGIQVGKMAEWPGAATGKGAWTRQQAAAAARADADAAIAAAAAQLAGTEHTEARLQHLPPQHRTEAASSLFLSRLCCILLSSPLLSSPLLFLISQQLKGKEGMVGRGEEIDAAIWRTGQDETGTSRGLRLRERKGRTHIHTYIRTYIYTYFLCIHTRSHINIRLSKPS